MRLAEAGRSVAREQREQGGTSIGTDLLGLMRPIVEPTKIDLIDAQLSITSARRSESYC